MEVIFNELKDKHTFKNKKIDVKSLDFHIGEVEMQTSIYIVGHFNDVGYIYRISN